jgi:chromosome segregation ATPase
MRKVNGYEQLKAAYAQASKDYTELLQGIKEAESDLGEINARMEQFKAEGKQQEFEELDNAFQQLYPDYTKMLRQLSVVKSELKQRASALKPWEQYFRDTGFYPGLR